jgi:tRNA1(Val) A37 N6-methylase TrmN6
MSDYEILRKRIGKQAADRLVKLGLLSPPNRGLSTATDGEDGNTFVASQVAPMLSEHRQIRSRRTKSTIEEIMGLDNVRRIASEQLDQRRRATLGQFMTPAATASFMASLFRNWPREISLLEPGAGIGSLACAFGRRFFEQRPDGTLNITAFEIEPALANYLERHLSELGDGRNMQFEVVERDFIHEATFASSFGSRRFSHVILNPPYKKIGADSEYRKILRQFGVETGNLYTAFLALAVELTCDGGEIVAIIPRSFCNGMYFRPFRRWLLERAALRHIHVFDSRSKAFGDDDVLQENIIVYLKKGVARDAVLISSSHGPTFEDYEERSLAYVEIVKPRDKEQFIHVPTFQVADHEALFSHTLAELGLDVATGPVVDFRVREHSLSEPLPNSMPLLYAHHFAGGKLQWPKVHKKPNALVLNQSTEKWLMPAGWYAITRRFSSKEEKRRVVSYAVDPRELPFEKYGFENHLNVIHAQKAGIDADLARGITLFLNSTIVDRHFRNFSGHTQVNATDLRAIKYPDKATLISYGKWAAQHPMMSQGEIDAVVEAADDDERRAGQRGPKNSHRPGHAERSDK